MQLLYDLKFNIIMQFDESQSIGSSMMGISLPTTTFIPSSLTRDSGSVCRCGSRKINGEGDALPLARMLINKQQFKNYLFRLKG